MTTDAKPSAVDAVPTQDGDTRTRWGWVEPSVWTDRMLTALERGVKGGVWFSLIDKVWSIANLRAAFQRVHLNGGAAGVDHVSCIQFAERLDLELGWLQESLQQDRFVPQDIRRHWIPKPGRTERRPLGIPTVRDRTVQTALRNVIEPIFERDFAEHSYGFRPGRGCKDALRRVAHLLAQGYAYVVDADLRKYFDTIPHDRLMALVRRKLADGRVLALLEAYLRQRVLDGLETWTPHEGTPQGAVISPLLANVYLDPLDHTVADAGYEMVRYADDFVILCRTRDAAEAALALVRCWTETAGLTLHPDKTRIVDTSQRGGFDFLGYHFERGKRWPSAKALQQLRDRARPLMRRNNGHSLPDIVGRVNVTLRGWFEYFKHGNGLDLSRLDSWVRCRLRSLLWRRRHRHGVARHRFAHQLWPTAYFTQAGLLSLVAAHDLARQSARR